MEQRESRIEKRLIHEVEKRGGLCLKFLSTVSGVPDRMIVYKGRVLFVELKTEEGRLSALQRYWISQFGKCGVPIDVLYGLKDVSRYVATHL